MIRFLRDRLRSSPRIHRAYHATIMAWKRRRYGLNRAHPTFIINGKCKVSRDLIAGAYGYMGPGCVIGPRVELGPYVMLASQVAIVGGDHCYDRPGIPMIFAGRAIVPGTVVEA